MPNILFINRVYPPQSGATGQLLQELAEALAQKGWDVTVLCSTSSDTSPPSQNNPKIIRVGSVAFSRAAHWRRALSYLSLYPALFFRALRLPQPDVIVTLTDPPLQLVMGPVLRFFKKGRLIHWAQDIYPEVAEELGVVRKNGWLAGILRHASTWALKRNDVIVAVGQCMKGHLFARGVKAEKIVVIPNWAQSEKNSEPLPNGKNVRQKHDWTSRLIVMYSGNLGLAHPFAAIVEAAKRLAKICPRIFFVFIGEGSQLGWLRDETKELNNVRFLSSQPKTVLAETLAAADLHLACMHEGLVGLVVPSKVYGILAAGRPCVFLGPKESEAAQTILRHKCGTVLAPTDPNALTDWLTQWSLDPSREILADEQREKIKSSVSLQPALEAFDRLLRF